MTKRMIAMAVALMLLCPMLALAEDAPAEEPRQIIGFVFGDSANQDLDVSAILVGGLKACFWLAIPEDGPEASEYWGKCVRYTLDGEEPEELGFAEPLTLEIAGEALYGELVSCEEEALILKGWDKDFLGKEITFHITKDTVAHQAGGGEGSPELTALGADYVEIFRAGRTCHVYYDPDTMEALWLEAVNG